MRTYPDHRFVIKLEDTMRFAIATNDYNPRYFVEVDKKPVAVPPMFGVVYSGRSLADPIRDPELNLEVKRLLHGAHDLRFLKDVRIGDTITSRSCIKEMGKLKNMDFITVHVNCWNQYGEAVLDEEGIFVIRRDIVDKKGKDGVLKRSDVKERLYVIDEVIPVCEDQAKWYAEVSGDKNPIHIDEDFARSAGFPGPILHGLCTMSLVSRVIVDEYLKGEPGRLKRLKVEFSSPVFPGDFLRVVAWKGGISEQREILHIEVQRDGRRVIRNGIAEVMAS